MTFQKDNDDLAASLAVKNNLDMDSVLAAYLIAGNDIFMLLHLFEGRQLRIPSKRRLSATNCHNIKFIEDDERKYFQYEKNDEIEYNGKTYIVISEEKKILNHYYIPLIPIEARDEVVNE